MGTELTTQNSGSAMTVKKLFDNNHASIASALPRHVNPDRLMRVAINAISQSKALQECTAESLFRACLQSFTCGLEPNGPLGEAYLVPFYDKGVRRVQFIPGYRGLISLARRSADVDLIYADLICEKDKYTITRGAHPDLVHEICLGDRGGAIAYYAVMRIKGSSDFEVMTLAEIERIRSRSKAAQSGPWVTDFDEMAKKTVLRRLLKRAPMSIELARGVVADEAAAMGEAPPALDVEGVIVPMEDDAGPAPSSPLERPVQAQPPPAQPQAPAPQGEPAKPRGRPRKEVEQPAASVTPPTPVQPAPEPPKQETADALNELAPEEAVPVLAVSGVEAACTFVEPANETPDVKPIPPAEPEPPAPAPVEPSGSETDRFLALAAQIDAEVRQKYPNCDSAAQEWAVASGWLAPGASLDKILPERQRMLLNARATFLARCMNCQEKKARKG